MAWIRQDDRSPTFCKRCCDRFAVLVKVRLVLLIAAFFSAEVGFVTCRPAVRQSDAYEGGRRRTAIRARPDIARASSSRSARLDVILSAVEKDEDHGGDVQVCVCCREPRRLEAKALPLCPVLLLLVVAPARSVDSTDPTGDDSLETTISQM